VSARLTVTFAGGAYDRTEPLRTGEVRPDGIELIYLAMPPEEVFYRQLRHGEFGAAEMSLSSYLMTLDQGDEFIAIPVFPSRSFRHNGIYVHAPSGITSPAELTGRLVGVPEYQMTAAVWIRGILAERHGLPVDSVRYRTGGLHVPGRSEKLALPDLGVEVEPIDPGRTLSEMLCSGELDALYSARLPRPFAAGQPGIRRLFADPRAVEEQYFADTGIFPIMHAVVLRRDLYQAHPWVARSLYEAFERARALVVPTLGETNALRCSLPWLYTETERTRAVMGEDYWSYGVQQNDSTLRALLRYSREQGLTSRCYEPAEIFAAETLDAYIV
jgi:4,5-dihydroxyphthalate decarboxylase